MLTGLDRLATTAALQEPLRGKRVGLLAHPASVDRHLTHVREVLARVGVRPSIIFGPEHGYGGEAQYMVGVEDARDADGTPIRSLYGATFDALSPRPEDLSGLDVLLIDLQDVGARYYTFVWTAVLALRACAKAGVQVVVLDRPNPIGGAPATLEGRRQLAAFRSFVGLEPLPIRHALTLGEIVAWRAAEEGIAPGALQIVAVQGLDRAGFATAWDRPFVPPSPNMPTFETALVYPGGCLLEGTNLSEGRGTTRPFEIVGAPWLDGARLARGLATLGLPGFVARPLTFRPTFDKHAGQVCGGVQIHVTDPRVFRPVATYAGLVALAFQASPEAFRFRTDAYEFVHDIPAFDLLTGDDEARTAILAHADPREVAALVSGLRAGDREIFDRAVAAAAVWTV